MHLETACVIPQTVTSAYMARTRRIFFFFNDTATTEIYTLSLHDALPISGAAAPRPRVAGAGDRGPSFPLRGAARASCRSEEHTSELQSRSDLVCRLLLETKKRDTQELPFTSSVYAPGSLDSTLRTVTPNV